MLHIIEREHIMDNLAFNFIESSTSSITAKKNLKAHGVKKGGVGGTVRIVSGGHLSVSDDSWIDLPVTMHGESRVLAGASIKVDEEESEYGCDILDYALVVGSVKLTADHAASLSPYSLIAGKFDPESVDLEDGYFHVEDDIEVDLLDVITFNDWGYRKENGKETRFHRTVTLYQDVNTKKVYVGYQGADGMDKAACALEDLSDELEGFGSWSDRLIEFTKSFASLRFS